MSLSSDNDILMLTSGFATCKFLHTTPTRRASSDDLPYIFSNINLKLFIFEKKNEILLKLLIFEKKRKKKSMAYYEND
jgi:hypothetical protein